MNKERIKKLESLSKQLVSNYIFEYLTEEKELFWLVTVTKTKISSDLSYLDIFVSSIKNGEILAKTLATHNHEIQSRFNKEVKIRKLPKIRFRYDDSWELWQKICQTIRNIWKK